MGRRSLQTTGYWTSNGLLTVALFGMGCALTAPPPAQPVSEMAPVPAMTVATVVVVNTASQFVVVDFRGQPLPVIGTRCDVFRQGTKVGTVQVTDPVRGRFATADIVQGAVQPGDEVRSP